VDLRRVAVWVVVVALAPSGARAGLSLDEALARHHALLEAANEPVRTLSSSTPALSAPDAITQGLDMVRDGGRMIVCGHYTDNGSVEIHPHWHINRKHVELKGCWGSRYDHFHRAVALTARFGSEKPWREMVTGRYTLDRAGDALAAVESRAAIKALITPNPSLLAG